MSKPPFEITNTIINIALEINNKLGKLEANIDKKKDLYLRKASKIKSVNSSCAIEANTLTQKEVEGIVNGKRIIAPPNEIIEVKNAYNAYSKIEEYKEYDIKSFLKAHKYLTENLVKESGKFRSGDVAVYDEEKVLHVGARPEFVYDLVNSLFAWACSSDISPIIKACILHYEIETIHPFSDGNGRIGRLWQSVILYNYNKLFELIPTETLVYEHQQEYYDSIEISRKQNSSTPFIEFMLDMISKTIDDVIGNVSIESIIKIKSEYYRNLSKNEKELLDIIVNNFDSDDYIVMEDLKEKTEKASSSIRNYFKKFALQGIIISEGKNKGRKYKINKDILE